MLSRPDPRRMQAELANAGFGFLLGGAIFLPVLALILLQAGPQIATAMILGGFVSLIFTLLVPGNPSRVGYRFARFPSQLSPHEQELTALVARLRKPWLMVVVNIPYFIGLLACILVSRQPSRMTDFGSQFTAGFFAFLYVLFVAWGVQYVQVLWSLRRESRASRGRE